MVVAFARTGSGVVLADSFNRTLHNNRRAFPSVYPRGRTLMMVADFGGQHRRQHFDTYAFLVFDLDRNQAWIDGQRLFRQTTMPNRRRMAFKAMNDKYRRRALHPFLGLADHIEGWLVLFAVSKVGGSLFEAEKSKEADELLKEWKPKVRERLLRIMHFSGFLLSGLSSPGQDVLWVIDEDEVAANPRQLTKLTRVLSVVAANSISHDLRHLRCGTTQSDDGSLSLEDLVAVCDLGAGALCEVATAMINQGRVPQGDVVTPLPTRLSWKSCVVASWLAAENSSLRRFSWLVQLDATSAAMRVTKLRWHSMPGQLLVP